LDLRERDENKAAQRVEVGGLELKVKGNRKAEIQNLGEERESKIVKLPGRCCQFEKGGGR